MRSQASSFATTSRLSRGRQSSSTTIALVPKSSYTRWRERSCMNIKIPAELLVIRLQKWVNENNRNGRIDTQELLDVLEVKTGIRADSIFAIFRMEQKTVMFATADKLMCAMHMQQQWYWPDLLPYYELLVPPVCPVCLEPLEAPVHRGSPRVYCSKACKHLASDRRWRKRHPERARQI